MAARQAESGPSAACAPFEAILLAAGESRRMGYPKPLLRLGSRTFIEILAAAMLQSVARLIVVVGAHAGAVREAIPADPRIFVVENPDYLRGQLSSIKAALPHVGPDAAGVLIHLADHPMVRAETFAAVIDGYRRLGRPIAIARYQGRAAIQCCLRASSLASLRPRPKTRAPARSWRRTRLVSPTSTSTTPAC